jgi:hypothetical protein
MLEDSVEREGHMLTPQQIEKAKKAHERTIRVFRIVLSLLVPFVGGGLFFLKYLGVIPDNLTEQVIVGFIAGATFLLIGASRDWLDAADWKKKFSLMELEVRLDKLEREHPELVEAERLKEVAASLRSSQSRVRRFLVTGVDKTFWIVVGIALRSVIQYLGWIPK